MYYNNDQPIKSCQDDVSQSSTDDREFSEVSDVNSEHLVRENEENVNDDEEKISAEDSQQKEV